jgi:hypothetical protein
MAPARAQSQKEHQVIAIMKTTVMRMTVVLTPEDAIHTLDAGQLAGLPPKRLLFARCAATTPARTLRSLHSGDRFFSHPHYDFERVVRQGSLQRPLHLKRNTCRIGKNIQRRLRPE